MTDDPAATPPDTELSRAIIVIAAIDQIFPGTYLPRFETNQIRAASPKVSVCPDPMTVRRQVSINRRYVAITMAVAPMIHIQSGCSD